MERTLTVIALILVQSRKLTNHVLTDIEDLKRSDPNSPTHYLRDSVENPQKFNQWGHRIAASVAYLRSLNSAPGMRHAVRRMNERL